LSLDELSFKHVLLQPPYMIKLKVVKLVLDNLGVIKLLEVLDLKLCPKLLVSFFSLLSFKNIPLLLLLGFHLGLLLLDLQLLVSLVKHIAHQHLGVQSFHSVLLLEQLLVRFDDGFVSKLVLKSCLESVDLSPFNFFLF